MKKIKILLMLFIFVGCHQPIVKTETDLINENVLFINASSMSDSFSVNGVQAKIHQVLTNPTFIGHNINQAMMGVRIYLDYPQSAELSSALFSVIDPENNEYFAIGADGLDFLGRNRGEHGNEIGYYRVSLPLKYHNFLLKYEDLKTIKYIHFKIESGE